MTKKENWLRLLRNENPEWISEPWEAFDGNFMGNKFILDPIMADSKGKQAVGEFIDQWGAAWRLLEGEKFANPSINDENKAIKDIKTWKEQIIFPPLNGHDWSAALSYAGKVDRIEYLVGCMIVSGLFERTHTLMGFQDALINYMIEPENMFELIGAITEWKIEHLRQVIEKIKPDVILFHDDWGNKTNLFLPPDVWRQTIRPHHKKIVDFVKSRNVIFIHHSDTICEPIVEDMADMGIDGWQGVIPQNNIPVIQETLQGRMALIGGIDAQIIDLPVADEEVIRAEVRRCIDEYCPQGYFIPCIPNIIPIHPDVNAIYEDELKSYGKEFIGKNRGL